MSFSSMLEMSAGSGSKASSNTSTLAACRASCGAVASFIQTLAMLVNNEAIKSIRWAPEEDRFIIEPIDDFKSDVLPTYFGHKTLASFTRQLNYHDFYSCRTNAAEMTTAQDKLQSVISQGLSVKGRRKRSKATRMVYAHPFFVRNRPDLLSKIVRRTNLRASPALETQRKAKAESVRRHARQAICGMAEFGLGHSLNHNVATVLNQSDNKSIDFNRDICPNSIGDPTPNTTTTCSTIIASAYSADMEFITSFPSTSSVSDMEGLSECPMQQSTRQQSYSSSLQENDMRNAYQYQHGAVSIGSPDAMNITAKEFLGHLSPGSITCREPHSQANAVNKIAYTASGTTLGLSSPPNQISVKRTYTSQSIGTPGVCIEALRVTSLPTKAAADDSPVPLKKARSASTEMQFHVNVEPNNDCV